jgi:hypothetical protein
MTLSSAVDEILQDVIYWIEQNKERGAWVMINFPSKFLHTAKLLVNTPEFNCFSKTRFLKARNLSFDFNKEGDLTSVRFNLSPGEYMSASVSNLNGYLAQTLHKLSVTGLSEKYQTRRGAITITNKPTSSFATGQDTNKKELVSLETIKNFKFVNN